jgi:predicted Zn-dependent peptidase
LLVGSLLRVDLADAQEVNIPFVKTTLPNGLVVILSEDHSVPQLAVNVSYSVGSRVERVGRTGFAHLFEHLMFMGTDKVPTKAFDAWMEAAGGRNNAWTAEDRTDYFDIAPPTALPLLLWLEADRMRNLGPLIDQPKLDLQREVVLNERRQSIENQPYGVAELALPTLLWPEGHPYHHPVIGSPDDLRAASVTDVKDFFSTWYDPANASIVVTGDFDPRDASSAIARLFGTIPTHGKPAAANGIAAPADAKADSKAAPAGVVRQTLTDNVELSRVMLAWRSPAHFAPGDAELDLLASVLSEGKDSRLYKALVYDQKIAQDVSARQESHVLESDFVLEATVRPGVEPATVEKALLDQVARAQSSEVSAQELDRARNGYEMDFVDRLQSVPERASLLNMYEAEVSDPGYAAKDLERYRNATASDIVGYCRHVLSPDAMVVLTIVPKKDIAKKDVQKKDVAKKDLKR